MTTRNTQNLTNLLTDVADYRMLSLSQIAHLHFSGKRAARRRMQQLVRERLVELLPGPPAQGGGRPENVYGLSKGGLQFLKAQSVLEDGLAFEQVGGGNLSHQTAHQFLLSWFRVHLLHVCRTVPRLACRHFPFNSPFILDPETLAPLVRDEVALGDDTAPVRFIPDGAFILTDVTRRKSVLFFLEVDRGTEPLSSDDGGDIRDKVSRYKQYFRCQGYKRYETHGGAPLNGFRLLFLTDSDPNHRRLCNALRTMGAPGFVWAASADSMFIEGVSGYIWIPGGDTNSPAGSILGSLAQRAPLPE